MSSPKSDATQQAMRAKVASKLAETLVSASSSSDVEPELAREISVEPPRRGKRGGGGDVPLVDVEKARRLCSERMGSLLPSL